MARVLVLGGTGFIGPYVVRELCDSGHEVCLYHRGQTESGLAAQAKHVHGSFAALPDNLDNLRRFAPDVVVDTVPYHDKGGHGVLHFATEAERAVVVTSADVYRAFARVWRSEPGPPDPTPLTESSPLRSKSAPDLDDDIDYDNIVVERAVNLGALPTTVLRSSVIFGPGDSQHRLYRYVRRMDDGRSSILLDARVAGWRCSRIYVEDVAHAVALAATIPQAAGRTYNVAPASTLSEQEWVTAIAQAHGWSGAVVATARSTLPPELRATFDTRQDVILDSSRIRDDLGYEERVPLQEALIRTIAWERANPPAPPAVIDYALEDAVLERLGLL